MGSIAVGTVVVSGISGHVVDKCVPTGMPDAVRMIASSVGENNRLEEALAVVNLASTRLGSASERLSSILMDDRRFVDWWLRDVGA
jgi:hypothetical protein